MKSNGLFKAVKYLGATLIGVGIGTLVTRNVGTMSPRVMNKLYDDIGVKKGKQFYVDDESWTMDEMYGPDYRLNFREPKTGKVTTPTNETYFCRVILVEK